MSIDNRRSLLGTTDNPESKLDYIVTLQGRIGTTQSSRQATIQLRYVPDRFVIEDTAFRKYLDALADADWSTFEKLAALILHDLNNVIVARWTQVQVNVAKLAQTEGSERLHTVTIEDHQPHWDNPAILNRL